MTGCWCRASPACGRCRFCREGRYGQCQGGGGWVLGHLIDGTQAEFVRVPFADTSLFAVPDSVSDEAALMLSDITPTAYEVGVLNGTVRPGDTVVVIGSGPIGLAAVMTAQLFSPAHIIAVDTAASRLEAAKALGADVVVDARLGTQELTRVVADLTGGSGCRRRDGSRGHAGHVRDVHPGWSGPAATSPTSVCTARLRLCTWRPCGAGTSPSPPAWSTPPRHPGC